MFDGSFLRLFCVILLYGQLLQEGPDDRLAVEGVVAEKGQEELLEGFGDVCLMVGPRQFSNFFYHPLKLKNS